MNTRNSSSERGQAIIVIALVMVVLLLFLALAIDGGNAYVHERIAQNAADSGSLSGAKTMLSNGATEAGIWASIRSAAQQNGIDPADTGHNQLSAWYIDTRGRRLDTNRQVGSYGYVPLDQGAAGIEVQVVTNFDTFVAQLIGRNSMAATTDSGAVVTFPNFCANWVLYANCPEGNGNCYNEALDVSGAQMTIRGGGVHSNSGLHMTGSTLNLPAGVAEWGLPGVCSDSNGVQLCPPAGPASQVPPYEMPILYKWEDFQPGGFWWSDMCQGGYAAKCNTYDYDLGSNDSIPPGLVVVNGSVHNVGLRNPGATKYTFVVRDDFAYSGDQPIWEPFVGSSQTGGSKVFIYSEGVDPNGVRLTGHSGGAALTWYGIVYAPHGLSSISASGDLSGDGSIYSWRINLSGANTHIDHSTTYCPPEQAKVTLLW